MADAFLWLGLQVTSNQLVTPDYTLFHESCKSAMVGDMTTLSDFLTGMPKGTELAFEVDRSTRLVGQRQDGLIVGARLAQAGDHETWEFVETATRAEPGHTLTPEQVRRVRLGALLAHARQYEATRGRQHPPREVPKLPSPSAIDLSEFASARRGSPVSDESYARLAMHYVVMVREGNRSPSKTLANRLGHGTPNQWTMRVREARRRGLLSPATPGEPGGTLTRKAEDILNLRR